MSKSAIVWLALAGFLVPDIARARALETGIGVGSGRDYYAVPVARMVVAFTEYSRWPEEPAVFQLCIVGPAAHANRLRDMSLGDGRRIMVKRVAAEAVGAGACQIVYLGEMPDADLKGLTAKLRGKGVLTIAETDPQCRSNAMFCLQYQPESLSFKINVDAVSRSGLKVDPRVLRLSSSGGKA